MKVLITGATGYAGFHAAIALRQAGHQVFGLVRDVGAQPTGGNRQPRAQALQRQEIQLAVGETQSSILPKRQDLPIMPTSPGNSSG